MFSCSMRASFPGLSGGGAGKGRRACNYVSGILVSASKKSMPNADWRDDTSNDVITLSSCFSMFVYIRPRSSSWLMEIWLFGWRRATGELDLEFKFQRRVIASSPSFSRPQSERPGELARRLVYLYNNTFKRNSFRGVIQIKHFHKTDNFCFFFIHECY